MIPRTAVTMSKREVLALLVVFIVYVVIGGAVFMAVEGPREEELRNEIAQLRHEFHERLASLNLSELNSTDIKKIVARLADARSKNLMDEHGQDTHTNWNFYNSFFFAITVVTTIGYGHLAPSTAWGRVFCVLYAVVGVPMTGILLAGIGDHFARGMVRGLKRARGHRAPRLALAANLCTFLLPWLLVFLLLPAAVFMFTEDWSYLEGLYYCFITLATIGFGDYVAGNFDGDYIWIYKTGVVLWIIFGLGYLAMILNYISRAMRCKQIRRVEDRLSASFSSTQHKFGQRLDEIHRLLQEFASKQKSHRKSIWRGKSGDKQLTDCGGGGADDDASADSLCGGSDKNHNTRDDQIQRLLTLVETLKEESTQNLCRTRQLIETHNLRLQIEAPYHLREELLPPAAHHHRAEGGLPRGEAAPSRRHSLPVLNTEGGLLHGPGGAGGGGFLAVPKDYLHVKSSGGKKNRSHLEFPTNFFAPRASIPLCNGRLSRRDSYDDDVYDVEIAVTKPMVTFDLDSLDSTTI
ncbi:LOW QUALITY PROTEIN: open rectifier potassium channel protein 1-like [Dermacentor silvarum]|uniref:LOW QUALITY PROTEIN: open rectifier potassium channel protein 1-like n=1 Tax=Dermacentor silvarum TaxID=543639 RepID=UPI00189A64FD|nr:LOW QUALITY PROTEIN: open rectifier potassium channel protein 1-like [Dermacentor silvarum]